MNKPQVTQEDIDFDAIYAGGGLVPGTSASFEVAPWDIGEPQPAVVALEANGQITGEVLDVGCGLGENAIFLAGRGYRVTGIDGAAGALDQARQRAERKHAQVEFVQAEASTLAGIPQRFDTVLDSALYHCLSETQRSEYAAALHRVSNPGAQLHLFCFADTASAGLHIAMIQISKDELREHLGQHWDIKSIEHADYVGALTKESALRQQEVLRDIGINIDPEHLRTDEQGRMLAPAWHLHAVRRS